MRNVSVENFERVTTSINNEIKSLQQESSKITVSVNFLKENLEDKKKEVESFIDFANELRKKLEDENGHVESTIEELNEDIKLLQSRSQTLLESTNKIEDIKNSYEPTIKRIQENVVGASLLYETIKGDADTSKEKLENISTLLLKSKELLNDIGISASNADSTNKAIQDKYTEITEIFSDIEEKNKKIISAYEEIYISKESTGKTALLESLRTAFANLNVEILRTQEENKQSQNKLIEWMQEKNDEIEAKNKRLMHYYQMRWRQD